MHRYTFHFEYFAQGWSETWYRTAPFSELENQYLTNYINRRLELLSTNVVLTSVRASDTNATRDVIIYPLPNAGRGGTWATPPGQGEGGAGLPSDPEDSFTALLLRLTNGNAKYRSFPMLGLPDFILQGGVVLPSKEPDLRSRLNLWINAVSLAGFGSKSQTVPLKAGKITVFSPADETNQLVCLGLKGTMPVADEHVILGSVKPFNKLNRTWRVASTAPGDANADGYIYLAGSDGLYVHGPVQGGKYRVPNYEVQVMSSYSITRLTARKTGIPFTTVRGRR